MIRRVFPIIGLTVFSVMLGMGILNPVLPIYVMIGLIFLRSTCAAVSMPSSSAISVNLGRQFGMGSTVALFSLATSIGMGIGSISAGFVYDY